METGVSSQDQAWHSNRFCKQHTGTHHRILEDYFINLQDHIVLEPIYEHESRYPAPAALPLKQNPDGC